MTSLAKPWAKLPVATQGTPASAIIRRHSKSFALASQLLPSATRQDAHALYAYCRRADDAVDLASPAQAPSALERLRLELDAVYEGHPLTEPVASEFQRVVFERRIPKAYPEALLDGFELDVRGASYATLFDLHRYSWCVAGSVGAMMCHVMGVRRESAVMHGAHLGMGMQLTNICRDIAEDWARGRLYVPTELLPDYEPPESWPPPPRTLALLSRAMDRMLQEADVFYRSGDSGLDALDFRCGLAVATARRVYSRIGEQLRARGCDVSLGRAVVPRSHKLWCVVRASLDCLRAASRAPGPATIPEREVRFPDDVLFV